MKAFLAIVLLTILSAAKVDAKHLETRFENAIPEIRGLGETIQKELECIISKAKEGIPEQDIPVLDPMTVEQYEVVLDVPNLIKATGSIDNLKLTGISGVQVTSVVVTISHLDFDFDILAPSLVVEGLYDIKATLIKFIPFNGKGSFKIAPKNARVKGHMRLGSKDKKLFMKEVNIQASMEALSFHTTGLGLFNDILDFMISQSLPGLMNLNEQAISESISATVKEQADEYLKNLSWTELVETIEKSASGICVE